MASLVSFLDIRDYAVNYLKTAFSFRKGLTVAAHPGQFDEAEIRRLMSKTPALLTSLVTIRDQSSDDNQRLGFVTWLLARATNADKLYDDCLTLLSLLLPLLRGIDADWSLGGAEDIEAKNLYSSSSADINVTLWAVSWFWPIRGNISITADDTASEGGILMPSDLEDFLGYDSALQVGNQKADDNKTF
jgi:hypothetical protein